MLYDDRDPKEVTYTFPVSVKIVQQHINLFDVILKIPPPTFTILGILLRLLTLSFVTPFKEHLALFEINLEALI